MSDKIRLSYANIEGSDFEDVLEDGGLLDGQSAVYLLRYKGLLYLSQKPFSEAEIKQWREQMKGDIK